MFNRVIIKMSGELLGDGSQSNYNELVIDRILSEIIELVNRGVEVSLVIGGGNIWRGRDASMDMDKVVADHIGMLGTIMNGLYISETFRLKGVKAVVMTPFDVNGFTEVFSKDKALQHLKNKNVVIFAGGLGHPYFSTDTIAALRACELHADALLYAKEGGVRECDPKVNPDAKFYKTLSYKTILQKSLGFADATAMSIASDKETNLETLVFSMKVAGNIVSACEGKIFEINGTHIKNDLEEEFYVN